MRIHHIGIAVADLDESIDLYRSVFGAELAHRAASEQEGLETALMRFGDVQLELMRPLREDSAVGKFVARRGPGMHHVAYAVADIGDALAAARDAGLQLIDTEPRIGLHGVPIAFVHPKSVGGVLTEFVEVR
ncbi:MAG TPA: methylmalonyl-CoA epimerase [Candidatus Dormibacteraeota bacterium]|jgi:methylmalonyl-CoA epimerase